MLFASLPQSTKYKLVQLAADDCNRYECNLSLRVAKLINNNGVVITVSEVIEQLRK